MTVIEEAHAKYPFYGDLKLTGLWMDWSIYMTAPAFMKYDPNNNDFVRIDEQEFSELYYKDPLVIKAINEKYLRSLLNES